MSELPLIIRPVSDRIQDRELAFVRETTVKVRWPRRAGLAWEEWAAMHGPQVDQLLKRAEMTVAVADGVLLGFLVTVPCRGCSVHRQLPDNLSDNARGPVVAMLYVKAKFRGDGIGMTLLRSRRVAPSALVRVWMPTASWGQWCARHGLTWERVSL